MTLDAIIEAVGREPYFRDESVVIYHGDALDIMPKLPSVALIVADPPYTFGMASTFSEGKAGSWGDMMNGARWYAECLREMRRLTAAQQGAAWVFNSWRSFPVLARAAMEAQWPIESLLVWDKCWIGPGGQRGLRPSYELVALFAQPDFQLPNRGLADIWRSPASSHKENGHPAEKPLDLVARLIRETPGELILDPFMGSGTTLRAAKDLGRYAIGIEIEERYCEIAAKRMAQGVLL